jgi:hypothetical protein
MSKITNKSIQCLYRIFSGKIKYKNKNSINLQDITIYKLTEEMSNEIENSIEVKEVDNVKKIIANINEIEVNEEGTKRINLNLRII